MVQNKDLGPLLGFNQTSKRMFFRWGINYMDNFYKEFEDRFRGSAETITSRQKFYLPFVEKVLAKTDSLGVLDLGCGRGEWLQLLSEKGYDAQGVDLDDGMLSVCYELHLKAEKKDVLEFLRSAKDHSYSVITAFHVVEHLPFESLIYLVKEAHRVLVPGGILVLETPNSENLSVGSSTFYIDFTHNKPLPSELLAFITEYHGFGVNKVIRLNSSLTLDVDDRVDLFSVLTGVSRDYAIIAQKGGDPVISKDLTPLFSLNYGVSLAELSDKYDRQLKRCFETFDKIYHDYTQLNEEYLRIVSSPSWKITFPFRFFWNTIEIVTRKIKNYLITKT